MALVDVTQSQLFSLKEKLAYALQKAKDAITNPLYMPNDLGQYLETRNAAGQKQIKADVIAEEVFFTQISGFGLNGVLYSEESGKKTFGNPDADDAIILLLDPLDGSKNFQNGKPFGCISLAFGFKPEYERPTMADLQGGMVLNLYRNECFSAIKGHQVLKNGKQYNHPSKKPLPQNRINIYTYDKNVKKFLKQFNGQYQFKSLGSVAWELVLAITKNIDMFIDLRERVKVHDFAASMIIAKEAGCHFLVLDTQDERDIPIDNFTKGYSIAASCDLELLESIIEDIKSVGNA